MKKKFDVTGMTCAACQAHVNDAVKNLKGVESCNVNLLQNTMDVSFNDNECSIKMIEDAVLKAGYQAKLQGEEKKALEKDHSLLNLILSFVFLILLMYFSMGVMMWNFPTFEIFDMKKSKMGFALIQFILVLPILYLNRGYFIRGFKRLFKGPSMDSLIAIGATASMAYSIYALFSIAYDPSDAKMMHMSLYFEAAGMILAFVSLGKYLESVSKKKTTRNLEALYDLAPKTAVVLKDGKEEIIDPKDVKVKDILIIKKGSIIPVDGIIVKGSASINQSNITGESIPVFKNINDEVYASTMIDSGYIEIEATKVGKDTSFEQILSLVEEASNSKAPISKLADKISSIFVPIIFIIAAIVFIFNILYVSLAKPSYVDQSAFLVAFNYAITVIVIACPCALGLATPVAIMVSTGKGAQNGLIIKNAEILERTGKIETVVFDKTGTITKGHPEVIDNTIDDDTLSVIYSLELLSNHPLSKAIVEYANKKNTPKVEITNFRSQDGMGLFGTANNKEYYIGNQKGIQDHNLDFSKYEEEGKTVLYVSRDNEFLGIITVRDEIKETSKEAIDYLKKMNIHVVMLTGDNKKTADAISKSLGIDECISEVLPSDKAKVVEELKKKGLVAMVGDGVNDAPALMTSNLGIAIGAGSDAAIESADIVLVRNDLLDVVNAIKLSKRTLFTIKLGLFWAFFYNLICVILASGLFYYITKGSFKMKPEYGSIAMSISSVSVVLNALSINLFKLKRNKNIEEPKLIEKEENTMATLVIGVDGMMCKHCKAHVEEAVLKVEGVESAVASLEDKNVTVTLSGNVTVEALKEKIKEAGYDPR